MAGLPTYEIIGRVAHGSATWLEVKCPRKGCERHFMVVAKQWAGSWRGHGRACPYCFKASKMPAKRGKKRARSKSSRISATSQH